MMSWVCICQSIVSLLLLVGGITRMPVWGRHLAMLTHCSPVAIALVKEGCSPSKETWHTRWAYLGWDISALTFYSIYQIFATKYTFFLWHCNMLKQFHPLQNPQIDLQLNWLVVAGQDFTWSIFIAFSSFLAFYQYYNEFLKYLNLVKQSLLTNTRLISSSKNVSFESEPLINWATN